ncbi:MAG: hypothetical protein HZB38_00190 [Planctomycetes bacterium]|nr:hypothetical protein [Planctomycetota bacterium]
MKRMCSRALAIIAVVAACRVGSADVPGDGDGDADIDFADFELISLCSFGPAAPSIEICDELFDLDFDADIDMLDLSSFQRCFSGEGIPADPFCSSPVARIEGGCLYVFGTAASASISLQLRSGAPNFLDVDFGNDGSVDFSFDRGLFNCIVVDAGAGDDLVVIDEANGVFTDTAAATVLGGKGDDTLAGGSGPEIFFGGLGDDIVFMGAGADGFQWDPGDGNDVVEGDSGLDTVNVNGGFTGENFTVTANGTRVRFDRLAPAPFFLYVGNCEELHVNAGSGNDTLSCTGNLAALIHIAADGGPGDDTLLGSNGADLLNGGEGNDFVDGNQGNDTVLLGDGEDTFQWDPGDGSDTVEGQTGNDLLLFNGSNGNENISLSANGARLGLVRDIGAITLDLSGVESATVRSLGGLDTVTVNDLAGTDTTLVTVDLGAVGSVGDAAADTVVVNGTDGADSMVITGGGDGATVGGLSSVVSVINAEPALDRLTLNLLGGVDAAQATGIAAGMLGIVVNGGDGIDTVDVIGGDDAETFAITANGTLVRFDRVSPAPFFIDIGTCENLDLHAQGGNDSLSCVGNLAALILISADGGAGDDTLLGGNGPDVLIGGDDNDFIDGNQGADTLLLGAGSDTFQWDPGDGNDTVEGQAGSDALLFNGSGANELLELSAVGSRLRVTRNIGNIILDCNELEIVTVRSLGGADGLTINSLAAAGVTAVNADLAASGGATSDGQADSVVVNGTDNADLINVAANTGAVELSGLAAFVRITRPDAPLDVLTVNGLGGNDSIVVDPAALALIQVISNP